MTLVYDERGLLECPNCGSHTFDMVAELRITDVSKGYGDPIGNRTIAHENIISLVCARCGARIK